MKIISRFARSRSGATAVEYALMATCIALGIILAVANVGTNLNTSYSEIASSFK